MTRLAWAQAMLLIHLANFRLPHAVRRRSMKFKKFKKFRRLCKRKKRACVMGLVVWRNRTLMSFECITSLFRVWWHVLVPKIESSVVWLVAVMGQLALIGRWVIHSGFSLGRMCLRGSLGEWMSVQPWILSCFVRWIWMWRRRRLLWIRSCCLQFSSKMSKVMMSLVLWNLSSKLTKIIKFCRKNSQKEIENSLLYFWLLFKILEKISSILEFIQKVLGYFVSAKKELKETIL